eukprot:4394157-Alexandrium_andersonii.AAC.1
MRKAPNCSRLLTGKMRQKHLDVCGLRREALQGTKAYAAVAAACASRTAEGGDDEAVAHLPGHLGREAGSPEVARPP